MRNRSVDHAKLLRLYILFSMLNLGYGHAQSSVNADIFEYQIAKIFDYPVRNYIKVAIDDGSRGSIRYDRMLKDINGKDMQFNSEVAFLNYYATLGWEVINIRFTEHKDTPDFVYYYFRRIREKS